MCVLIFFCVSSFFALSLSILFFLSLSIQFSSSSVCVVHEKLNENTECEFDNDSYFVVVVVIGVGFDELRDNSHQYNCSNHDRNRKKDTFFSN